MSGVCFDGGCSGVQQRSRCVGSPVVCHPSARASFWLYSRRRGVSRTQALAPSLASSRAVALDRLLSRPPQQPQPPTLNPVSLSDAARRASIHRLAQVAREALGCNGAAAGRRRQFFVRVVRHSGLSSVGEIMIRLRCFQIGNFLKNFTLVMTAGGRAFLGRGWRPGTKNCTRGMPSGRRERAGSAEPDGGTLGRGPVGVSRARRAFPGWRRACWRSGVAINLHDARMPLAQSVTGAQLAGADC